MLGVVLLISIPSSVLGVSLLISIPSSILDFALRLSILSSMLAVDLILKKVNIIRKRDMIAVANLHGGKQRPNRGG